MYFIRLSKTRWLGDRNKAVAFNSDTLKGYRRLDNARKAAAKAYNSGLSIRYPDICTIDFGLVHCPIEVIE
jgi:hypothetical protein